MNIFEEYRQKIKYSLIINIINGQSNVKRNLIYVNKKVFEQLKIWSRKMIIFFSKWLNMENKLNMQSRIYRFETNYLTDYHAQFTAFTDIVMEPC